MYEWEMKMGVVIFGSLMRIAKKWESRFVGNRILDFLC